MYILKDILIVNNHISFSLSLRQSFFRYITYLYLVKVNAQKYLFYFTLFIYENDDPTFL